MASPIKAITPSMANIMAILKNFLPAEGILAPKVRAISCTKAAIKKQKISIKHHHCVLIEYVKHRQRMINNKNIETASFDLCMISGNKFI